MIDDDTWERLAMGELSAAERARVLGHVTGCRECAAIYRGLARLEADARAAGLGAPPPSVDAVAAAVREPTARRWGPRPWLAGAMVGLAAAAVVLLWVRARSPEELEPGHRRGAGRAEVVLLAPAGAPPTLAWQPVAGAVGYRVSVFTADGRPVLVREVTAPPLVWPAEVAAPAGELRWKVEALGREGPLGTSRLAPLGPRP